MSKLAVVAGRNWTRPAASWHRCRLPVWVKLRRTQIEQIWSARAQLADLGQTRRHFADGPEAVVVLRCPWSSSGDSTVMGDVSTPSALYIVETVVCAPLE